jgi:hypothetical protein
MNERVKTILHSRRFWLAVLVLAGAWWWVNSDKDGSSAGNPNAVRVTVASVERKDVPNEVGLVGTVVAYETVAIKWRLD